MRNKLLVDVDGTITSLSNYVDVLQGIIKKAVMDSGVDISGWDVWKIYNAFLASDYADNVKKMKILGIDPEVFWNRIAKEDYNEREKHYGKTIKLYDDVSILRGMAQNGFEMGILTDQPNILAKRYVEIFNLDFFREMVCGNYMSELSKPGIVGAKLLMDRLGATTDNSIMIGDSDIDIITAKRLGIPVIQIKRDGELDYGPQEPDAVIKTFHELPEAIKKVSKK
ncbi:MAG: HAD hydrolase-like protein [Deltaproteobacteria bacterium]|nr:HAD hydrolase-like protein [Deltaproteobacteria bacterium]